jgi:hypothetical protein
MKASGLTIGSAHSLFLSRQIFEMKRLFCSPHVEDENCILLNPVIEPAWFDPNLAIVLVPKLMNGPTETQEML